MLRTTVLAILAGVILVVAVPALAVPPPPDGFLYPYKEHFDDYATGTGDANYATNWTVPPGMVRISIDRKKAWSAPNHLYIVDTEGYGISYNMVHNFQLLNPLATGVNGTDDTPLRQSFLMWCWNKGKERKYCSSFIELSMGDVQAPMYPYSGPQLPVIAFGWTRGMGTGTSVVPKYFDGQTWHSLSWIDQNKKWNNLLTKIYADRIVAENTKYNPGGFPPQTKPRAYLGSFDTIKFRAPNNDAAQRCVDDIFLVAGVLTGPPIPLDMDILPNDDPNNFTVLKKADSKARLPIEVYGSAVVDASDIDLDSIRVAGTVIPVKIQNDIDYDGDGIVDLKVHLNRVELINALDLANEPEGAVVDVVLTGAAVGGCPIIEATDSVVIHHPGG